MDSITIITDKGNPKETVQLIETDGFLLLFLKGDSIKSAGNISLKSIAPILTKIVLERMSK